jgi:diadenosine tetraphosphate (Ap4A) HIT family hydrolase
MASPHPPQSPCLACAIVRGEQVPPGGAILETAFFHAHQDVAYPVPGFVILATKRHVRALDELTPEEAQEFITLVQRIRQAQRAVLGIEHVYYFYNEDTAHHFHAWLLPRYPWMDAFGRSVESVRPALRYAQATLTTAADHAAVRAAVNRLHAYLSTAP